MTVLNKFKLENRVALITGGNRGLGKAMATALAEAGCRVAITSRNLSRAVETAHEISETTGMKCIGYECDVTSPEQVRQTVDAVVNELGKIEILINNAGINIRGKIEDLTLEEFKLVQDTNVTGVWLMCKAVTPYMKNQAYGRVINMGSMLSIVTMPERTPYSTSKGAVLQLTRTLALEWATSGITVNAIMPGPFGTEMNQVLLDDPERYQAFIAQIPMGRWGNLDEIGPLAVFLASEASSFITGTGILIDGGWTAR